MKVVFWVNFRPGWTLVSKKGVRYCLVVSISFPMKEKVSLDGMSRLMFVQGSYNMISAMHTHPHTNSSKLSTMQAYSPQTKTILYLFTDLT